MIKRIFLRIGVFSANFQNIIMKYTVLRLVWYHIHSTLSISYLSLFEEKKILQSVSSDSRFISYFRIWTKNKICMLNFNSLPFKSSLYTMFVSDKARTWIQTLKHQNKLSKYFRSFVIIWVSDSCLKFIFLQLSDI